MRFSRLLSLEVLTVAGASAAVGCLLGVGVASAAFIMKSTYVAADLARSTARVQFLEGLVEQGTSFGSLQDPVSATPPALQDSRVAQLAGPSPAADNLPKVAAVAEMPTPVNAVSASAPAARPVAPPVQPLKSAEVAPPPKIAASPPSPAQTALKPVNRPTAPAQTPVAGKPAVVRPAVAALPIAVVAKAVVESPKIVPPAPVVEPVRVSADEVAAVLENGRVEGVSAQKAGVLRFSDGGVQMSSGRVIRVGERFASGEKLLQVDSGNNRLVTSDRQILLFFN